MTCPRRLSSGPPLFPWLMTAAAFAYVASSIGYAATASRRFRWQPLALAASVVVSTISCWLLIPEHGLQGAAWAMIATSLTSIVAYSLLFVIPGGQK